MNSEQLAYLHLRNEIISGRLAGGVSIRQEYFAEILTMSRMPVRDAIKRLHAEGLVTILPNRTVIVTQLSLDDVTEIFAIRAALERLAMRFAFPRLTAEMILEAQDLVWKMDRAVDDIELWIARHEAFHNHICQASGLPRLASQIDQLRVAIQPYFRMFVEWQHNNEIYGYEHQLILDAMTSGNAAQVEDLIEKHILGAGGQIRAFLAADQRIRPKEARDSFDLVKLEHGGTI
jgi:DNA-binding GntR family transcriptional regulator